MFDKLRHENREIADDIVKGKARQYLEEICRFLPDETPEGREVANLIFKIQDEWHKKAVNMLIDYTMNEGNDLSDYPHLRQKLVDAINNGR